MKINKNARVTTTEIDALREKHRGIAMGVEGQDMLVHVTSLTIMGSLANQPGENGRALLHTFRMPLYTQNALEFATLHRLNDAIRGTSCHTETLTRVTDGLMMERVDI